jgi:hypothetical protein
MNRRSGDRVFPARATALIALATLGAISAAFYVIGRLAAPHSGDFDWSTASVAATAAGTLALAITTGTLAYSTAADVSATRELAEQGRRGERERIEPMVAIQSVTFDKELVILAPRSGFTCGVTVKLANVGLGPATSIRIAPTLSPETSAARLEPADHLLPTLGPGKEEAVRFLELTRFG